jgi:hypothetical protein
MILNIYELPLMIVAAQEGNMTGDDIRFSQFLNKLPRSTVDEAIYKLPPPEQIFSEFFDKFDRLVLADPSNYLSYNISKASTNPNNYSVYYYIDSIDFNNTKYPVLLLKFTDSSGNIVTERVDYTINKINENNIPKNGTTYTGFDMLIFSKDTLPETSVNNMQIDLGS